ncbi:MAG: sigma-70 family RNA polymerase sigma factor [Planctomycetota bacterium]
MSSDPPAAGFKWETEWDTHSRWLRTILLARLRDDESADEMLQEIAVIAWQKQDQLSDSNKAAPWLYRIAVRKVQEFWRKKLTRDRRWRQLGDEEDAGQDVRQIDPLVWMTDREACTNIREALATLNDQDREILMLKHTEGWTYSQISTRLGISMDKVIYRLNRAKKRLRLSLTR